MRICFRAACSGGSFGAPVASAKARAAQEQNRAVVEACVREYPTRGLAYRDPAYSNALVYTEVYMNTLKPRSSNEPAQVISVVNILGSLTFILIMLMLRLRFISPSQKSVQMYIY